MRFNIARFKKFLWVSLVVILLNSALTYFIYNYETCIVLEDTRLKVLSHQNNELIMMDKAGNFLTASFEPQEGFKDFLPYEGQIKVTYLDQVETLGPVVDYKRLLSQSNKEEEVSSFAYSNLMRNQQAPLIYHVERVNHIVNGLYLKSLLVTNILIMILNLAAFNPWRIAPNRYDNKYYEYLALLVPTIIILLSQMAMITFDYYTRRVTAINWTPQIISMFIYMAGLAIHIFRKIRNKGDIQYENQHEDSV